MMLALVFAFILIIGIVVIFSLVKERDAVAPGSRSGFA